MHTFLCFTFHEVKENKWSQGYIVQGDEPLAPYSVVRCSVAKVVTTAASEARKASRGLVWGKGFIPFPLENPQTHNGEPLEPALAVFLRTALRKALVRLCSLT